MSDKPRLTVRPSRHGFVAQASRGGERWFSVSQEAPTREAAWLLVQPRPWRHRTRAGRSDMSERIKKFTRRDIDGNLQPVFVNARHIATVENAPLGGAKITIGGDSSVLWVEQSLAEVCAWLRDDG